MSFNRDGGFGDTEPAIQIDKFPCTECQNIFLSRASLDEHKNNGHLVGKPQFFLKDRELLEQTEYVYEIYPVSDWKIVNAETIQVNDKYVSEQELLKLIVNARNSLLDIVLTKSSSGQKMRYRLDIKIPDKPEVDEVTRIFKETFLVKDSAEDLSPSTFTNFYSRCSHLLSAERYASGLHSFLNAHFDKLKNYDSPEFLDDHYLTQIQRAGAIMARFNSNSAYKSDLADVICAGIAFDENEFEICSQRVESPAFSSTATRLLRIRDDSDTRTSVSEPSQVERFLFSPHQSLITDFCSIPLDGSAKAKVAEIESRLMPVFTDKDLIKVRAVLSAHYLGVKDKPNLMRHLTFLRKTAAWAAWADWAEKEILSDGN